MGAANQTCTELNRLAEMHAWPLRCDDASRFSDQRLEALCQLWHTKANGGVPARAAFDLRSLSPFAKHIVILERVETETGRRYKFRLFGSAHMLLFGDHTGQFLDEMVSPEMLPGWLAYYDAVLMNRQPLRVETRFRTRYGAFLESEIFAAPMRDDAGQERLILAATFVDLREVASTPFG
jgi:hypothetical protein